jgi:tRNA(Ile)-lysidine synthase
MKQLYPPFKSHIFNQHLLSTIKTIILAFSGGKDSVTLLYLLKQLQKDIPFQLIAAYFNHHLRDDAMEEEHWIRETCRSLDVELVVGGADVARYRQEEGLNLEHAASLLRYQFLEEAASGYPQSCIATAHTKTDITETFFIKLLRGSGNRGLAAIYSKKGTRMIRPLLPFHQDEILGFLERNHIDYYQDSTNLENHFLRNKIRNVLLPVAREMEPNLDNHIYRSSLIFQQEYDYFHTLARDFLREHLLFGRVLPMAPLKSRHLALRRHILREYVRLLKGDLLEIGFDHIEGILAAEGTAEALSLPGIDLALDKNFLMPLDFSLPDYSIEIPYAEGCVDIPEIDTRLRIEILDDFQKPVDNNAIILPYSPERFPLLVRHPRQGDRYVKINSRFAQTVFEMIRCMGFPPLLRHACPVIRDATGQLVWVCGSPVADAFKVTDMANGPFVRITREFPYQGDG